MAKSTALNLVGTAGEYYVCAELCRRGYLALLTPKNNPLFDVVATDQTGSRSVSIQVKTRSVHNKQGWKLGADMASAPEQSPLFVVLVNLKESGLPDFLVYEHAALSKRVAQVYHEYITKPKKDGTAKKEVGFRWFDEVSFTADDRARMNNWSPIENALAQWSSPPAPTASQSELTDPFPFPSSEGEVNSKYEPLRDYLAAERDQNRVRLTFAQIEVLVGKSLPPSAYNYREWWANQANASKRPHARAWTEAGFAVETVDQTVGQGYVDFVRR